MVLISSCGRICIKKLKINLSQVFAGQAVGIKEVNDAIWLVTFMDYDLGYFDEESKRFEPLLNPFGAKVLPMSSVLCCPGRGDRGGPKDQDMIFVEHGLS